ncbi:MAG: DUF2461 domain-containing protein [Flavobacteriales bacterium]|nr:DUF2461 domain-containing protein [Flavobacteriales bacterium]
MIQKILDFLKALAENNNREWFAAHRNDYLEAKDTFEHLVEKLIPIVLEIDPAVGHLEVKDCTYRIYRDIRFSPDKRPYKTHMGAYINRRGKKSPYAGYYIHLDPTHGSLWGGGLYCPDADTLRAVRMDIYDNIDEFLVLNNSLEKSGFVLSREDSLKKIPAGFPRDFPHGEFLKMKHYDMYRPITDDVLCDENRLIEETRRAFAAMMPMNRFLNYTIDETLPNIRSINNYL